MLTRTLLAFFLPLLSLLSLSMVAGCKGDASEAHPRAESAELVASQGHGDKATPGGTPKIAADEAEFDFGGIARGGTVEHVFTIKNVGDGDLQIERVQKT